MLRLEGFVYQAINADDATVGDRLGWLHRHPGRFLPQPYEQLAGVYRREGNEQAARTVAIAKQRARRADIPGWRHWPTPAKTTADQPGFNPARYTADLLLPVVNFKQRDVFVAHGWVAWASFGFVFAGWLLALVVVAGLTGVFKRD